MFQGLSDRLEGVFGGLRRKAKLTEADVTAALREIRVALLEADVALPVAKDLMARVKNAAVGADLVKKVTADQQVVKIVNDELDKNPRRNGGTVDHGLRPAHHHPDGWLARFW